MNRVLFVDDEPNVLQGLQRMLRPLRDEWEMRFAAGGQEALVILRQQSFDVIVTDMLMPVMTGAELLEQVQQLYPQTIRVILSGQADRNSILASIGSTHQYLSKPCDTDVLRNMLHRSRRLHGLLENEALQRMVAEIRTLPSLPALYSEIMEKLQEPDTPVKEIAAIIGKDLGMTAKVMQLVNSAYFGLSRYISDPAQAVSLIGLDTIKALVLSTHIFSRFNADTLARFSLESLWKHSLSVGTLAVRIARAENQSRQAVDHIFTAGLLHDVGVLVIADHLPVEYEAILTTVRDEKLPLEEVEQAALGATHSELGAYLIGLWGLPDSVIEAILYHHHPMKHTMRAFNPVTAVYAADALDQEAHSYALLGSPQPVDEVYLTECGAAHRLHEWRRLCEALPQEEVPL